MPALSGSHSLNRKTWRCGIIRSRIFFRAQEFADTLQAVYNLRKLYLTAMRVALERVAIDSRGEMEDDTLSTASESTFDGVARG